MSYKAPLRKWDFQKRYENWWLGKRVRTPPGQGEFRLVTAIELVGPPSFVYGNVWLTFEDGTTDFVKSDPNSFKPIRADVEVENEKLNKSAS